MEKMMAEIVQPDQYFWYVLATVLASALIWIIGRYIKRQDRYYDAVNESLDKLTLMTTLHEEQIKNLEKDVEKITNKVFQ